MIFLIHKRHLLAAGLLCCFLAGMGVVLWKGNAAYTAAFAQRQEGVPVTVILDPGHGGEDGGAVSADGTPEAGINLSIALQMREIARLVEGQFITPQQGAAVRPERIAAFFASSLGRELKGAPTLRREFKFSLLVRAADYDPRAGEGEQVLLQGVVDCYFETPEGLAVVDFKTDRVTERTVQARAEAYRPQLEAYSRALEAMTGRPVIRRALWFFALDRAVEQ